MKPVIVFVFFRSLDKIASSCNLRNRLFIYPTDGENSLLRRFVNRDVLKTRDVVFLARVILNYLALSL